MTRIEFLRIYCDLKREQRQTGKRLSDWREAEAHGADRHEAARLWRRHKNWLQNITTEEWKKQELREEQRA